MSNAPSNAILNMIEKSKKDRGASNSSSKNNASRYQKEARDLIADAATSKDEAVQTVFAKHPFTPQNVVKTMFLTTRSQPVLRELLKHPRMKQTVIDEWSANADRGFIEACGKDEATTAGFVEALERLQK